MHPFDSELLDLLPRIGAALACGMAVGINRDLHGKPAGFRTFSLVALGSAIATIAAVRYAPADPTVASRVGQGVLTGLGFLGAGLIVRREHATRVSGLTTAAAVWSTAALGIAAGLGLYALVLAGIAAVLLVLVAGGSLERGLERLFRSSERTRADDPPQAPADDRGPRP